jgi:hypothetical protein
LTKSSTFRCGPATPRAAAKRRVSSNGKRLLHPIVTSHFSSPLNPAGSGGDATIPRLSGYRAMQRVWYFAAFLAVTFLGFWLLVGFDKLIGN